MRYRSFALHALLAGLLSGQEPAASPGSKKGAARPPRVPKPGIKEVQKAMDLVKPEAVFPVPGVPDWTTSAPGGIWVSNKPKGTISKLDAKTGAVTATVEVGKSPCSGIAYGFGSLWVPNCGDKTNKVTHQYAGAGGDAILFAHGSVWLSNLREQNIWRLDPAKLTP